MGASCLILSAAAPWATAVAQTESTDTPVAAQGTNGDEEAKVYESIVVTATRRAEKLSEVPIAMSVFGDDAIDQTFDQDRRKGTDMENKRMERPTVG